MKSYLENVRKILMEGEERPDRTGTGTVSYFGTTFEHDMKDGFPLMTHKRMGTKSIFAELVWFLSGDTNSHNLEKLGSTIWKKFAAPNGDIGPMYGAAWRGYAGHRVDQIGVLLRDIKHNPESRRLCVSAWHPEMLPDSKCTPSENAANGKMSLAPCHTNFQCYVSMVGELHLTFTMRSSDTILGAPYNIASYGALLHIMAYLTDLTPGRLIANFGDSHIYMDHIIEGHAIKVVNAKTYTLPTMDLSNSLLLNAARETMRNTTPLTIRSHYSEILDVLFVDNREEIIEDLRSAVHGYVHGPSIKMNVSV